MFTRQGTLMAVQFNPASLTLEGEPLVVLDNVVQAQGMSNLGFESGVAQLAYSSAGHLAYVSGGTYPKPTRKLVRVTPEGLIEPFLDDEFNYLHLRVSPDERRVAFGDFYGSEGTLYIHDFDRSITRRLDTGDLPARGPLWSPDGQSLIYSATTEDNLSGIYRISATGSGGRERLVPTDNTNRTASSVSATGAIVYLQSEPGAATDIWVRTPEGGSEPLYTSESMESWPVFSPDGNWILYGSNQTGRSEIFIRPYPQGEPEIQVSGNGGSQPIWAKDGSTIFFTQVISDDDRAARPVMVQASFTPGNPPTIGRIEPLIFRWPFTGSVPLRSHDILSDGSFITHTDDEELSAFEANVQRRSAREINSLDEIRMVLNFVEEMRQRTGQN